MLIDTHCHIHEADYPINPDDALKRAVSASVAKVICVGTSNSSSRLAVEFAGVRDNVFAAVGVHPYDTKDGWGDIAHLLEDGRLKMEGGGVKHANSQIPNSVSKIVAVGEIGLDYYYDNSPREVQIRALEAQIDIALTHNLPIIFHVRDAFDDFWPIVDNFRGVRGVVHSFTDNQANLDGALARGLFVGVNGISTFTKDQAQKHLFASIPLDKLLLETDAPFLTPAPFRGKVNEPAFVKEIAEYHATIRGIDLLKVAEATSANAQALFAI